MKKMIFVCCLSVLMLAGVASAAVTSDMYGTYTGTLTIGSAAPVDMTVTIGADMGSLSMDTANYYIWAPEGQANWNTSWNDAGTNYMFSAWALPAGFGYDIGYTYSELGSSTDVLYISFLDPDHFTVSGVMNNTDNGSVSAASVSGSFSATPIPGAIWLLGSGLMGLVGLRRRNRSAA